MTSMLRNKIGERNVRSMTASLTLVKWLSSMISWISKDVSTRLSRVVYRVVYISYRCCTHEA
jgi:hypothetical protein